MSKKAKNWMNEKIQYHAEKLIKKASYVSNVTMKGP